LPTQRPSVAHLLALVTCAISLGSAHVFARLAFANGVNLFTAAMMRAGCASLIVALLLVARRTWPKASRRTLVGTLILGVFVVGQTLLIQVGVKRLPVTVALLLFYTYPFFVAIVSSLLGDHRLSPSLLGALALAFTGLILVLGVAPGGVDPIGVAGAVGAAVVFTGTLVLTPRLAPDLGAPVRTFLMMTAAATFLTVLSVSTGNVAWPASGTGWIGLAGLAVLYGSGIVGLFLLLPKMGPVQTAVVLNLEPVFVAVIAWATLGESLTLLQMAGAALVVCAVIYSQLKRR
jgi:drug/metabolite transporter (DMT)-like permease